MKNINGVIMRIITTMDSNGHINALRIPDNPEEAKKKIRLIFEVLNYDIYDELDEAIENFQYDYIEQDLEEAGIAKSGSNLIVGVKEITEESIQNFLDL